MEQTPKADPPVAEDEHDRKLLADVEQFGWHMVGIEQDNEGPAFVYSVGLYQTFRHCEILVVGLSVDVMFGMRGMSGRMAHRWLLGVALARQALRPAQACRLLPPGNRNRPEKATPCPRRRAPCTPC